jgi:Holliday junction resolvase
MLESKIQSSIRTHLERQGWFVTKLLQTSTNGIPDLMALRQGKVVFIEVKQPGRKPSPLQEYRIGQLRKEGFEVIIATSKKDVEQL